MEPAKSKLYSVSEYLDVLKVGQEKYEYLDGYIWAMSGGTHAHGKIVNNINTELNLCLRGNELCKSYSGDVKIFVADHNGYFFPDASVICGEIKSSPKDPDSATNPVLLVEVLSTSTELFDRGDKFRHYRKLPSLREYVLIAQEKAIVEVFYKTETGFWRLDTYEGLEGEVDLRSMDCRIHMADIYRGVTDLESL